MATTTLHQHYCPTCNARWVCGYVNLRQCPLGADAPFLCGTCCPGDPPPDPQTPAAREAARPRYTTVTATPACPGALMVNVPGGHDHMCSECGEEFLCPDPERCDHDEYQRCPACAARADEAELQAGLLATLPPMAGGSDEATIAPPGREGTVTRGVPLYRHRHLCPRCGHRWTCEFGNARDCNAYLEGREPYCSDECEHTHPCPTCHQERPCTGTGCADGPRECITCSQCRGW